MRIFFFKFPLRDSLAGAEFHTLALAKHFVSAGHEVELISSDRKLLGLFKTAGLSTRPLFVGFEPTSIWSLLVWPATYCLARTRLAKLLSNTPPDSVFFMQSLTEKLILTRGSKNIWLEHKIPGRWLSQNPMLRRYLRLSEKTRIVTVSDFAKKGFVRLGVPEKNIEVIYPGIPLTAENRFPPTSFTIGILSRLAPEKGVFDFLRLTLPALLKHPHWQMLIAGEGDEMEKIISFISQHKLENQIRLLGFVQDKRNFFSKISTLCYPTKASESFGLAAAEALAAGVPVIASGRGGLLELLEDGKNGYLVNPEGSNDWLAALERCAESKTLAVLSKNARARAGDFDENLMFANFDRLLHKSD